MLFKICKRCLLVALLGVFGCGGIKTYPVQGVIRYKDGKSVEPLARGAVEFEALEGEAKGRNARGDIQPDGSFSLTTFALGTGAVEGKHRVLIVPPAPKEEGPAPKVLAPRFRRYETSNLVFTVTPDAEKNQFVIEVTR